MHCRPSEKSEYLWNQAYRQRRKNKYSARVKEEEEEEEERR